MKTRKTQQQLTKELRAALIDKYGARNYKIDKGDDVYIYGPMPQSQIVGWWYMGSFDHACDWMGIDRQYSHQ
jgi:hypothetical protein